MRWGVQRSRVEGVGELPHVGQARGRLANQSSWITKLAAAVWSRLTNSLLSTKAQKSRKDIADQSRHVEQSMRKEQLGDRDDPP